jgi:cytochrome P450
MDTKIESLKSFLRPRLAVLIAHCRSILRRRPLPAGDLIDLFAAESSDRELLLKLAANHGPIFKAFYQDNILVCVIGTTLGRRLLREHGAALRPVAPELRALFPKGFMRQMEGEDHRHYRTILVRCLNALDSNDYLHDLEIIVAADLRLHFLRQTEGQSSAQDYSNTLSLIASSMLLRIFFGAEMNSAPLNCLLEIYSRLGPDGFVWNITERQIEAYGELCAELRTLQESETSTSSQSHASSLFCQLSTQEVTDETLIGNLIYMVETGRYDLRCLLRWISKYAAENPEWIERIFVAEKHDPEQAGTLAKAFVLETLRMDQSERLMRNVMQDIVFDGYTIPKNSTVRVCMWEAHKDAKEFTNPFTFDPERFLNAGSLASKFSPFGLDHHRCPFSNMTIELCGVFLRTLARRYKISPLGSGPAVRGKYHWETAKGFSVALLQRENIGGISKPYSTN